MSVVVDTESALAIIGREQPELARRIGHGLGARVVRVEVDAERFELYANDGLVRTRPWSGARWDVEARTTRATLRAVLSGQSSLDDAILDESVALRGDADELVVLEDLLALFVHAAVRAPSMAALWERFTENEPRSGEGS